MNIFLILFILNPPYGYKDTLIFDILKGHETLNNRIRFLYPGPKNVSQDSYAIIFTFPQYSHASFFELPRGRLLSVVVGVGITDWPGSCVGVIVGKTGYPNWLGSPGMNGDRIPTNKG